jgi:hypothetical protein
MKQVTDSKTQTENYTKWRRIVLVVALIPWLLMVSRLFFSNARSTTAFVSFLVSLGGLVVIAVISAVKCFKTARQFGQGEAARWAWLLIGFFSIADGLMILTTWGPNFLPGRPLTTPLGISSHILAVIARVLTACSFLLMIRIYRQSGFRLKLRPFDYCAFVVLLAAEVAMVMAEGNMARISSFRQPVLEQWLKFLLPVSNFMLVACSVLGILLWRYARQMGGGLVAKAWQFVVLYLGIYIIRRLELGFLSGGSVNLPAFWSAINMTVYFGLGFVCSYLLYLGASFQYEACTRSVETSDEEFMAELSALELQEAKL